MQTIHEVVAERLSKDSINVRETVINNLTQIEVNKRVNLITEAVAMVELLEKDLNKIERNDVITYVDGQKQESMSKNRFEDIEKLKQKIANIEKEVTDSLDNNTEHAYTKLADILKKVNGNDKNPDSK
jgi:hypothetical protein